MDNRDHFKAGFREMPFCHAAEANTPGSAGTRASEAGRAGTPITLPPHLFIPQNAQSIDIRRVRVINPGQTFDLMTFRGLPGSTVRFLGYGIFNDGLAEDDYSFLPLLNGRRIFPYHGNPMKNYLISLGLAPDLGNEAMIECQLQIQPEDVLVWRVTNKSAVDTAMGVRMKGYIDFAQPLVQPRFGG